MKHQGDHLATFSQQIAFALDQFRKNPFQPQQSFSNVVICGLGGSGIAGRLVSNFVANSFSLPISIVSDYDLPAVAKASSLIICSSYSGNTEETLSCFDQATQVGATCIVLSGGGKLTELAKEKEVLCYPAQLGYQPRMALGYPLTYLLLIVNAIEGIGNIDSELEAGTSYLAGIEAYKEKATALFEAYKALAGKPVEIIADSPLMATAIRFQQQLNENPKVAAFVHPMPEMCHNVIESFTEKTDHFYLFLDSGTNARNSHRMAFNKKILDDLGNTTQLISLPITGLRDLLEANFIFDWYSLVCADYLDIVSSNIPNIVALKESLSRI